MKVRISKCYLVQVLDDKGNEVSSQYYFGDRTGAAEEGKRLKEKAEREERERKEAAEEYPDPDEDTPWAYSLMEHAR